MPGPRSLVSPPVSAPREYGLLSVVQPRFEETDRHWRNGVTFEQTCGGGGTTFDDYCVTGVGSPAKVSNVTNDVFGARPVTALVELDCGPVGYDRDEQIAKVSAALIRVEEWQLERAFWTGTVAGGSGGYVLYPHLAANAEVLDPDASVTIVMQQAVTTVTGATLDAVEALARLEFALDDCVQGKGVVHVTTAVFNILAANHVIEFRNGRAYTPRGNLLAVGAGYTGSGPDGTSTAGVHWMYATANIFAYRSSVELAGGIPGATYTEMFDRDTNTAKIIAERTYVLGYGCCLVGAPVSLGGVVSGIFNSAT